MRPTALRGTLILLAFPFTRLHGQASAEDQQLLNKARGLYDAPFQHKLVSFDCAVDFDWSSHFRDLFGALPPDAAIVAERLQSVHHRISVLRSGVKFSAVSTSDLADAPKAAQFEELFKKMVPQGLNAWLPSSTDALLPRGNTTYWFDKAGDGYKVKIKGENVQAELILGSDLRLTTGVVQAPQASRFDTTFQSGPNGYLLSSVTTADMSNAAAPVTFEYTYQGVEGFQIPLQVTIKPKIDTWIYSLSDCKVTKGVTIQVLPKSPKDQN